MNKMKMLIDENLVCPFCARELYKKVLNLFDDYYIHKLTADHPLMQKAYLQKSQEEFHQKKNFDSTFYSVLQHEKALNYIEKFEKQIEYIKEHFTAEENIIFTLSVMERKPDKSIIIELNKSEHYYYKIKKSCYLKIALRFELIRLKEPKKITQFSE